MPLSYAHTTGDGVTRNFDVPCEYLSKAHISVKVDGVAVPFSWIDTYRLLTATAPPSGSVVEVRRTTPRTDRLVTFTDGSTLVQSDLNTSTLQSFFLSQEAFDQGAASMAVTEDGAYSAQNRRISNVANPVNGQDVVTKAWALVTTNTNVGAAVVAKDAAVAARTVSETARDASVTAKTASEAARDAANTYKVAAETARNTAETHKVAAQDAKAQAEAARDASRDARDVSITKASEAAGSADDAAQSAAAAALFDPASYYTKAEITTTLDGKLDKSGGDMTGPLTITYTGGQTWGFLVSSDGRLYFQDIINGPNPVSFGLDGSITTTQLGDLNTRINTQADAYAKSRVSQLALRLVSQSSSGRGPVEPAGGRVVTGLNTGYGGGEVQSFYTRALQLYDPVRGWVTASFA